MQGHLRRTCNAMVNVNVDAMMKTIGSFSLHSQVNLDVHFQDQHRISNEWVIAAVEHVKHSQRSEYKTVGLLRHGQQIA